PSHLRAQLYIYYATGHPQDLHSFPTRRSSDLTAARALNSAAARKGKSTSFSTCEFVEPRTDVYRASAHWASCDGKGVNDVDLPLDRKSTRLNSSHGSTSYAVFCLEKINDRGHR